MIRPIVALFVLLLAGCAASAQTRTAYVDVNALVPQHPLYGTLAQYDRQIAALESTLHTRFSNADAQFTNATNAIRKDASSTTTAYNDAAKTSSESGAPCCHNASGAPCCHSESGAPCCHNASGAPCCHSESGAPCCHNASGAPCCHSESGAPCCHNASGAPCCHAELVEAPPSNVEATMQATYQQQHAQLQDTARSDMAQYRAALQAQEREANAAFVDSMNERVQRAVDLRAQELRERESNLLLELARAHGAQRLMLRAKLQTLVLRDATRKQYLAQLNALQAQEDRALSAARRADAATLNAYKAHVESQAQSDLAKMQSDLATRTAANLAARERVLQSQTSSSPTLALPAAPRSMGSPADMQTAYNALTSSTLADASAFGTARDDIASNWTALRQANDDDIGHTRSQIDWLRHDREAVRKRIIAQILFEASRIAKSKGYDTAVAGHAPSGSPDLTSAVAADLRTLSP